MHNNRDTMELLLTMVVWQLSGGWGGWEQGGSQYASLVLIPACIGLYSRPYSLKVDTIVFRLITAVYIILWSMCRQYAPGPLHLKRQRVNWKGMIILLLGKSLSL